MKTEEVLRARERALLSARFRLVNRQRIVTPGKNGSSGHPVPKPSGAEAIVSDR